MNQSQPLTDEDVADEGVEGNARVGDLLDVAQGRPVVALSAVGALDAQVVRGEKEARAALLVGARGAQNTRLGGLLGRWRLGRRTGRRHGRTLSRPSTGINWAEKQTLGPLALKKMKEVEPTTR